MTESAILAPVPTGRADKRQQTARRIVVRAQELALEHGIDGFTMDDLARRAEVSRRTLFNYFPSKDDAVLGGPPVVDADLMASFVVGGPTGQLLDDLAAVVVKVMRESPDTREDIARGRAVMQANPRLVGFAHRQLEACIESCMPHIATREGQDFDRARVDMAIALIVACCHVAMDRYLGSDMTAGSDVEADLATTFTQALDTARQLLA